jgi:hypothetical protein
MIDRHQPSRGISRVISSKLLNISLVAAALLFGCASTKPGDATTQATTAPDSATLSEKTENAKALKALDMLGDDAEAVYDLGNTADWPNAPAKVAALKEAAAAVENFKNLSLASTQRLGIQVTAADAAVTAKDKMAIMLSANQITLIAADLADPLQPTTPTDVTRLDYLGRELEIWSTANNPDKVKSTVDQINTIWTRLKPTATDADADEAKIFDAIITKMNAAKTNDDYLAASKAIDDGVDKLAEPFER